MSINVQRVQVQFVRANGKAGGRAYTYDWQIPYDPIERKYDTANRLTVGDRVVVEGIHGEADAQVVALGSEFGGPASFVIAKVDSKKETYEAAQKEALRHAHYLLDSIRDGRTGDAEFSIENIERALSRMNENAA